jgi:hypothetical protein
MAGEADFFANGEWNFFCDLCGRKQKSGRSMKTWNNLRVCKHHREKRNPQDFLRGVKDDQSVPWSRPEKEPETFVGFCTLQSSNAIPGFGVPGCMIPGLVNLAFLPSLQMYVGWAIQDTLGDPIEGTNGSILYPPGTPQQQVI